MLQVARNFINKILFLSSLIRNVFGHPAASCSERIRSFKRLSRRQKNSRRAEDETKPNLIKFSPFRSQSMWNVKRISRIYLPYKFLGGVLLMTA